ncbi:MAG: bacteriohemerythrin [Spirochaetota bacterium]
MPVLLWKLREILARRLVAARVSFDFSWRDEFSVGIPLIDEQHRKLFGYLDSLAKEVTSPASCADPLPSIAWVKSFALEHFATEEDLMAKFSFPDLEAHAQRHREIISDIEAWQRRLDCGDAKTTEEFCEFLMDWLLRHTLSVDRHYIGRMG